LGSSGFDSSVSRGAATFREKNAAAPRLENIFEIADPSAHALGYLDIAAPRLTNIVAILQPAY
jgi:hypothetical protein